MALLVKGVAAIFVSLEKSPILRFFAIKVAFNFLAYLGQF